MRARSLWLVPLIASLACTGLFLENGNAYPCDFSLGPGVRDEACQPGDVCGTNDVCQPFIYEGPRFEGQATVPEYGPSSGEGAVLHPLVLKSAAREVSGVLPLARGPIAFLSTAEGTFRVEAGGVDVDPVMLPTTFPPQFGALSSYQPFFSDLLPQPSVIARSETGRLAVVRAGLPVLVEEGGAPFAAAGFRVVDKLPLSLTQALPIAWNADTVGKVQPQGAVGWEFLPLVTDAGAVLDVAAVTLPLRQWLLVMKPDGLDVVDPADGGVTLAATMEPFPALGGSLKTDPGSRVVTAVRRGPGPMNAPFDVLSTFQVNIAGDGPTLSSPWPDCRPCRVGRLQLIAPSVRSGAPTVDVLCRAGGDLQAFRVVGSVALTQFDACLTEPVEASIELEQIADAADGGLVSWDGQFGLLLGGRSGELWSGDSLTSLQPTFLDRVPLDVAPASAGALTSVAVLTDEYLAVQETAEVVGPTKRLNGFRRLPAADLDDSRLLAFVHGVNGWAVTDEGELLGVRLEGGVPQLRRGPVLVTPSEEPIRSTIGGEAYVDADGGAVAFFVAADDSLYFAPKPEESGDDLLVPVLTPEPSVPIRSLALERTPLGTDGADRARGYLVTSRNVYRWELSGNPARWSSTALVLTGGEPMEVWFDSPRSALGRVGYRDGQIYSLPGGYQLAEALPKGADGISPQVIDFENLGGWPVAYATTGLFVAGWDQVDGKLQNRFPNGVNKPMTWREVKLAGTDPTPWMRARGARAGKLFVAVDPKQPDGGLQPHRLLLFNEDEVRQVARHLRK